MKLNARDRPIFSLKTMLILVTIVAVIVGLYTNYNRYFIFNLNLADSAEAEDDAVWLLHHKAGKRGVYFYDANRNEVILDDNLDLTEVAYVRFRFYDGTRGEHQVISQYNLRHFFIRSCWSDLKYLPATLAASPHG